MANRLPGKLIVFEGTEGVGKTTQLKRLYDWLPRCEPFQNLQAQGTIAGVMMTRQPGGTELGKQLRQLLLQNAENYTIGSLAELLLYAADRAQHVSEIIRPKLEAGFWVICDRYTDSTVAYQGYGRGLSLSLIEQLNSIATDGLQSSLTLWLQLDADLGLARTHQRGASDRIEQAEADFHRRVQQGFENLAQIDRGRIVPVNGARDEETIAADIQQIIEQRLWQWYRPLLKQS